MKWNDIDDINPKNNSLVEIEEEFDNGQTFREKCIYAHGLFASITSDKSWNFSYNYVRNVETNYRDDRDDSILTKWRYIK